MFHLAAQIDVRKSISEAAYDARINVEGTINLLEAVRPIEGIRVINTSTGGAIYGEGRILPATEEHPVAPEAGYGQSKFAAEGYCDLYSRLHGVSTVSLRYGNVFGPRQDPLGEAGVIAIFCGRLLAGERPTIFGNGLQTRDYVYVGDVVEANLAAATSPIGGPVNIGRGVPVSVVDLVNALSTIEGRDLDPGSRRGAWARCRTSTSTRPGPRPSSAGRRARDSRRGSRSRSTRCAEPQRRTARLPA